MAGISNYLANAHALREFEATAFTDPATIYVALLLCTNGPLARSTAYALNNTVSYVAADGQNHLYTCTTAGTTAATAPTYPGAPGEAITDGTAVFTEQSINLKANSGLVEPTVGGYARLSVATNSTDFAVSGNGNIIKNAVVLTFVTPTAPWQTSPSEFWGWATFDAATAGNLLRFGGLTADQIINTGNTVAFAIGAMTYNLDNAA